ncbi:MAG: hypothetical protein CMK74_00675 [Pseudomonadales bacterium]|nr:hypothetical protein [Pseudomonadales bacterium]
MTLTFKVTKVVGTPVFVTHSTDLRLSQIYGATLLNGLWHYPAYHPFHRTVLADIKALELPVTLSSAAQQWVHTVDQFEQYIKTQRLPVGFEFKTQPYAHQMEGLVHALYFFRAALFYACGLGKTKIILDWHRATGCYPLILCPRTVLSVWGEEPAIHGINQELRVVDGYSKKKKLQQIADAKDYPGVVMSYGTASRYYKEIAAAVPYNAIVADESHQIKGETSTRSKTARELSKKAARRIIMSGTPSLGDPRDMYPQLRFLAPYFAPEAFWKFKQQFCVTAPRNKRIVIGFKNLHILRDRVTVLALDKTKEECLDLPGQQIIDIPVKLTGDQRRVYNGLLVTGDFASIAQLLQEEGLLSSTGTLDIPNPGILVFKLQQVTSGFVLKTPDLPNICDGCEHVRNCVEEHIQPYTQVCKKDTDIRVKAVADRFSSNAKLDVLRGKLSEILAEKSHKCIIWAQFREEMNIIEEALDADGWAHVRVDGTTPKVGVAVNTFNTDPECRVYLGQVATGVGITLNSASYTIYFSLPCKLESYLQSLDRNYRVGQTKKVTVYRLLGKATVDMNVARALSLRKNVAETITTVLACSGCPHQAACLTNKVALFDSACIYSRRVTRPTIKPRELE